MQLSGSHVFSLMVSRHVLRSYISCNSLWESPTFSNGVGPCSHRNRKRKLQCRTASLPRRLRREEYGRSDAMCICAWQTTQHRLIRLYILGEIGGRVIKPASYYTTICVVFHWLVTVNSICCCICWFNHRKLVLFIPLLILVISW